MKKATISWTSPVVRELGEVFDPATELLHMEVHLSADGGVNFGLLDNVVFPQESLPQADLIPGEWIFRLIAVDVDNEPSAPVDTSVQVLSAPGGPTNIQIVLN